MKIDKKKMMVQFGNKKLPKTTMIFNMGSATNCPSKKLGLCKVCNICYAMKAEKQYPDCLPYRNRQEAFYAKHDSIDIAKYFIQAIEWKMNSKYPVDAIRFSEAGDFSNQAMVDKLMVVFSLIKKAFPKIRIYGYTARKDLNFTELMKFATVNGSNKMISNEFKAVDTFTDGNLHCQCNCDTCTLCHVAKGRIIEVLKH